MKLVSCAGKLQGDDSDLDILLSPNKYVYCYSTKVSGQRKNFYYICSTERRQDETVSPPRSSEARSIVSVGDPAALVKDRFTNLQDWWLSGDAETLFCPLDDKESALDAATNMLHEFENALARGSNALVLVEGFRRDITEDGKTKATLDKQTLAQYSKQALVQFQHDIQERATYLRVMLRTAVRHDGRQTHLKWREVATQAMEQLEVVGFARIKNPNTLLSWFRQYRDQGSRSSFRAFLNFLQARQKGPQLLKHYPLLEGSVKVFIDENLDVMSAKVLQDHIVQVLIPKMIDILELDFPQVEDESLENTQVQAFLLSCGMKHFSESAALDILHYVGLSYALHQKSYFTNNHEKYKDKRIHHVWDYLYNLEQNFPVWVKIPLTKFQEMRDEGTIHQKLQGRPFFHDGKEYRELHVCDSNVFFDILFSTPLIDRYSQKLGPDDIRYIPCGHDEALCNQYDFSKRCWKGTKGQQAKRPKGKGRNIMMSGIIGWTILWNMEVTDDQLKAINNNRRGQKYKDEEAAVEINKTPMKPMLKMDSLPFLKFVEVGSNNNGLWWNGDNFILQVEDLSDCIYVLYADVPNMRPICFTDWSQGHAQKRPDGLDATRMNKLYGGKQVIPHDTTIGCEHFGPFVYNGMMEAPTGVNKVIQSFRFKENDAGPCYMSPQERLERKYDFEVPGQVTKELLPVRELREHVKRNLHDANLPSNYDSMSKSQLIKLAKENGILHYREKPKIREGWLGKAKGILQVLWETGWIDGAKYHDPYDLEVFYAMGGKKDATGKTREGSDLLALMSSRQDFKNELTMAQHMANLAGLDLKMSVKCHCEIAGLGIEVVWGVGKVWYRRHPVSARNTAEKFRALVRNIWSRENIGKQELRGIFRTHRSYMLAYYEIHREDARLMGLLVDDFTDGSIAANRCSDLDFKTIQEKMKNYKNHLCVMECMGKTVRDIANLSQDKEATANS